jgi:hypothetical protein
VANRTRPASRPRASAPTRGTRPASRRVGPLLAAAAVVAVGVVAWIVTRDGGSEDPATGGTGADTGVEHVHGLGVDPADGTLYVATHYGTFRVPADGPAQRIGDSLQDTMGFTVVGADYFLGSGHPDQQGFDEGQPPLLGLIESTDGGQTWEALSLSGEVDFHALAYAHDQVYGWDSTGGGFMVSADKTDWDTRSTLDLFGFAVDPADADQIVATTPEGVQTSSDGGTTWQPTTGAPELALVAWDVDSGLWGVDPGGTTYHATALDAGWEQAGSLPGPPQALLADGETLYAAAADGDVTGIYQSTDAGTSWELRDRDDQ